MELDQKMKQQQTQNKNAILNKREDCMDCRYSALHP